MSVTIYIPARYASTRYPAKPLAMLKGASGVEKSLIHRAWLAARAVPGIDHVAVATDDDRIAEHANGFGADVVMTSSDARNGTERCAEALANSGEAPDIIVNLQGDAPLTPGHVVTALIEALKAAPAAEMATPVVRCDANALAALQADRREGRVGGTTAVLGPGNRAIYFSKEVLPYTPDEWSSDNPPEVWHHLGVYAYRPAGLKKYAAWPECALEKREGLEQLRFLENGANVLCVPVDTGGATIWELNNPQDVPIVERLLAERGIE